MQKNTTTTRQPRQSREVQRNAKLAKALAGITDLGKQETEYNTLRVFRVASTTQDGYYKVTVAITDSNGMTCNCPAGRRYVRCVHMDAVKIYMEQRAADAAVRARQAEQRRMDTALLARNNRPFSLLAR